MAEGDQVDARELALLTGEEQIGSDTARYVIATVEAGSEIRQAQRDQLENHIGSALADAKLAGCGPAETRAMIQRQIARLWGEDQRFPEIP